MKNFTQMTEGKLDNLEYAFVSLFMKNHPGWRDGSKLVMELLKSKGLALEKQLIGKRGLHKYSVKIEVDVTWKEPPSKLTESGTEMAIKNSNNNTTALNKNGNNSD